MSKLKPLSGQRRALHRARLLRLFPIIDGNLGTCCATCDSVIQDAVYLAGWSLTEYYQAWGAQEARRGSE